MDNLGKLANIYTKTRTRRVNTERGRPTLTTREKTQRFAQKLIFALIAPLSSPEKQLFSTIGSKCC